MALAVRELELILIARDHASATIARVGGALTIMGGALALAGIRATREFGEMAREAAEFQQGIALAVTQADGLGATIENVGDIVNRVGKEIPIPFEELTESLYDIFSTFTTDQLSSLEDAETILQAFAESATAGQAPIQDIGRSVIAWINALDQPATLENVNRILDIQFELVRKGAGTYGEFAGQVGKAIPAFVAAGQTTETFGGALAFLTKNGLSAAMASTSAARAVELMYAPKAIKGLTDVGIAVEDSSGKFRSMVDIIRDLQPVFNDLSDAEKKIKFKEIFGTGRIQARRFFDLVMPNFAEFEELVKDMETSAGGVADAFQLMFDQPLSQLDLFKNKWELLRRELGEVFLQKMETTLFPALDRFFDWWDGLDEAVKENIATWALWGAAITIATGILMAFLGIALLVFALLQAFGGGSVLAGIAKLGISLGWVTLVLAAIAAAAYLIWQNWETIWPMLIDGWARVQEAAARFWAWFQPYWDRIVERARVTWGKVVELGTLAWQRAKEIWKTIWDAILVFWEKWGKDIVKTGERIWKNIVDIFEGAWDVIDGIFDFFIALLEGDWSALWEAIKDIAGGIWDIIVGNFKIFTETISQIWRIVWDWFKDKVTRAWNTMFEFLRGIWNSITETASRIWNNVLDFFSRVWDAIVRTASDTLAGTGGLLEFFQNLPGRVVEAVSSFALMILEWMLDALIGMYFAAHDYIWETVIPFFADLPMKILRAMPGALSWLYDTGVSIIKGMWNGVKWYWDNVFLGFWKSLAWLILWALPNTLSWLFDIGKNIIQGLWEGAKWVWHNLMYYWISGIAASVKSALGDLKNILWDAGWAVIDGLWRGMKSKWSGVTSWLSKLNPAKWFNDINPYLGHALKNLQETGEIVMEGLNRGMVKGWEQNARWLGGLSANDYAFAGSPSSMLGAQEQVTNNDYGQTLQFGDIVSQADPEEIAAAIAWELRMS